MPLNRRSVLIVKKSAVSLCKDSTSGAFNSPKYSMKFLINLSKERWFDELYPANLSGNAFIYRQSGILK
jgi:hypothetical protein